MAKLLLIVVTLTFGAFSAWVMLEHGYLGIWRAGFINSATLQILDDLIIACSLASLWMIRDARQSGRNPWPYVVITLTGGSFGPLLYLLVGEFTKQDDGRAVLA